jgi:glutathione S-transferase
MTASANGKNRRLYTMPYSPWSERARWALLHHGLPFEEKTHTPLTGEIPLRFAARRPFGKVTVPLLVDGPTVVMDSTRIAEYVDPMGSGSPLFPAESKSEIESLALGAEPAFNAGRALLLEVSRNDDEAAMEFLPPALRRLPFAAASSRVGSAFIASKHSVAVGDPRAVLRAAFEAIRARLAGKAFIVGSGFTYADILAATTLQYLKPVDDRYVPIGPRIRAGLTDPALVGEFPDLVAWRDALYAAHRPVAGLPS